jgi:hypothetical protein
MCLNNYISRSYPGSISEFSGKRGLHYIPQAFPAVRVPALGYTR